MTVLFLTLGKMDNIDESGIYTDLLRRFSAAGDEVYVVGMHERREGRPTTLKENKNIHVLQVRTGNIRECGTLEKGISTVLIEGQYKRAIRHYFPAVSFDLVMYSTPPITFSGIVAYVKKKYGAKSYLLLKDIFPQNAVDLGMMHKTGLTSVIYRYFRQKEKKLYELSDYIGCMSPKNREYLIAHNYSGIGDKTEVCPNSVDIQPLRRTNAVDKAKIRARYSLSADSKVIIYGGNLGRAQGIPDLIECLKGQVNKPGVCFVIVGKGTEYGKLQSFIEESCADNIILKEYMPVQEYGELVSACDVGMLFLDHRFTIPNFPSRLLAYLQAGLPVLACTDRNTDVGDIAVEGGFGWKCFSDSPEEFSAVIDTIKAEEGLIQMGENGYCYLKEHYDVGCAYETIMKHWRH